MRCLDARSSREFASGEPSRLTAKGDPFLPSPAIELAAIGSKAHAALSASGGTARLFATVSGAWYVAAGDEVIWAIAGKGLPHPRAVLLIQPLPADWREGLLAYSDLQAWKPAPPTLIAGGVAALAARARSLAMRILLAQAPRGMALLLAGRTPPFPFAGIASPAMALAQAIWCPACDPAEAVRTLIGLGPGLTPSGDDYVVGICFAARLRATAEPRARERVEALHACVAAGVAGRTNRISAAFLGDALEGLGLAALHEVCNTLAEEHADPLPPALRLVGIGHSSGWDILTGLLAGLGGL
jgi:hypothetical protein